LIKRGRVIRVHSGLGLDEGEGSWAAKRNVELPERLRQLKNLLTAMVFGESGEVAPSLGS
jgi:hypothetical protein